MFKQSLPTLWSCAVLFCGNLVLVAGVIQIKYDPILDPDAALCCLLKDWLWLFTLWSRNGSVS